jgi:DUF1365 family protein
MHARVTPVRRRFVYRVFSIFLDVDDVAASARSCAILSYNRFNILTFRDADHGRRDGTKLRPFVEDSLLRAGIATKPDAIRLLCFPRLWGLVFNPLSVFYCYTGGRLTAVLYEVNNTFGDTHTYAAAIDPKNPIARHDADKNLYVSPLIGMKARYEFAIRDPRAKLSLAIRESGDDGLILTAVQTGDRRALSTWEAIKAVARHPLMTLKIVSAIHIEALGTWLRGARYVARPLASENPVSLARPSSVSTVRPYREGQQAETLRLAAE